MSMLHRFVFFLHLNLVKHFVFFFASHVSSLICEHKFANTAIPLISQKKSFPNPVFSFIYYKKRFFSSAFSLTFPRKSVPRLKLSVQNPTETSTSCLYCASFQVMLAVFHLVVSDGFALNRTFAGNLCRKNKHRNTCFGPYRHG